MLEKEIDMKTEDGRKTALAVGKFDGLHRGHQLLLNRILEEAPKGLQPVVLTVEKPDQKEMLLTPEEFPEMLSSFGIGCRGTLLLTEEARQTEAEDFIRETLLKQYRAGFIATGNDFRFGRDREGDVSLLSAAGRRYGFDVEVFDRISEGEEEISSRRIRKALKEGDVRLARTLLGYPYFLTGTVMHGRAFGRTLGVPTLNFPFPGKKAPLMTGVYRTETEAGGKVYPSVTDYGFRPTFGGETVPTVETHLIGDPGSLYGETVRVRFLEFLRPEIRFDSKEELIRQIRKDIESSRFPAK